MSVAKILPLLSTAQGTLQQRSGGVTGPLNRYQSTIIHLVKTFRIKTFKKSIKIAAKACNQERIINSDLNPEVDASLNMTCRKVMITYCITKSNNFKMFDWLVLKLQDTETETLKPHYIHVYKVFG